MDHATAEACQLLLAERNEHGWWEGELSTSALSTATAVHALLLAAEVSKDQSQRYQQLADGGLKWLMNHQNEDGGWGDTVKSVSNISTTMLVHAVLAKSEAGIAESQQMAVKNAADYISKQGGVDAVIKRYGKDHTFSVPILTHCALAGTVDWDRVMPLPFELACVPAKFYAAVKMPVVSYALPALIAIGQVIFEKRPPRNPLVRWIRRRSIQRSLQVLDSIQPSNGGFLEATPLTSFVCMSLLGCGRLNHPVTQRCLKFIEASVRDDGSWPIDTNLTTWVTTLSVNGLCSSASSAPVSHNTDAENLLPSETRDSIRRWLLDQQYKTLHPFTNAAPGGWSWIDQPGGVPDADDTPGAMLALMNLRAADDELPEEELTALRNGANWLLDLQNRDGGWPTFCRGWGTLPFDRSSNDITAHALRALHRWQAICRNSILSSISERRSHLQPPTTDPPAAVESHSNTQPLLRNLEPPSAVPYLQRLQTAIDDGFAFLAKHQREDGSWLPLWFGNQHNQDDENPLYGTSKVLMAYAECGKSATPTAHRAVEWVIANQNEDGGWSAVKGLPNSIEETGLAVECLAAIGAVQSKSMASASVESMIQQKNDPTGSGDPEHIPQANRVENAAKNGVLWLRQQLAEGRLAEPSPIGFYFAKLWYFERLYPLIFAVSGLRKFESTFGETND